MMDKKKLTRRAAIGAAIGGAAAEGQVRNGNA
jgi:hypothetical protein